MKIIRADATEFRDFFQKLRRRGGAFTPELLANVAQIIHDVSVRGDEALFHYTKKFDGYDLTAATVEATAAGKKRSGGQSKTRRSGRNRTGRLAD